MKTGEIIKSLRRSEGLSQKELSERVRITRTYLAQVESGKKDPGLVLLRDIAAEFDMPVALLLVEESNSASEIHDTLRSILRNLLEARDAITE